MIKCYQCNEVFSYKDILIILWKSSKYKDIICKDCGCVYRISYFTRILLDILIVLPVFFSNFLASWDINIFLVYFPYIIALIIISPIFVKFKLITNKQSIQRNESNL